MITSLPSGCERRCRGCSHRHLTAQESENQKEEWLQRELIQWYSQESQPNSILLPIRGLASEKRWNYRRKTCLHAVYRNSRWEFGLLIPTLENEFEVLAIPDCPVHSPEIRSLLSILSTQLPVQIPLSYVVISGKILTLVLKCKPSPVEFNIHWKSLGVISVYLNFHPSAGNRIFSNRGWKLIFGPPLVQEEGWYYGAESFQQLIPELYQDALHQAEGFLHPSPDAAVLDLYSGIGLSLRVWEKARAPYLGVELNGNAVECSRLNTQGGHCLRGRVEDRLPQLSDWIKSQAKPSVLFANPPRLGISSQILTWIIDVAKPLRIAYLSCSGRTLARDLRVLDQAGYEVEKIIPYDFFPQTYHVEALALLRKKF